MQGHCLCGAVQLVSFANRTQNMTEAEVFAKFESPP
jgi:hypothetical protein